MFQFTGYLASPFLGTAQETSENTFYWGDRKDQIWTGGLIDGAARDAGNSLTDILRPGLVVGRVFATKKLKEWSPTATDGTQFVYGILDYPAQRMQMNGTNQDRFRGTVMVRGTVKPERLLIGGSVSYGIGGNANEYLLRAQLHAAGFLLFEDPDQTSALLGFANQFMGGYTNIQAKTADYTIKPYESGTLFTTRGAVGTVIFTLPVTASKGLSYGFFSVADQILRVTSGTVDNEVAFNDLEADSVSFQTAGEMIGGAFKVIADGTSWLMFPYVTGLGLTSQTLTVAT